MKLKIEKEFRDKITGQIHKVNSVVEFEAGRAKELLDNPNGFVSMVVEKAPKEEKPKKTTKKK